MKGLWLFAVLMLATVGGDLLTEIHSTDSHSAANWLSMFTSSLLKKEEIATTESPTEFPTASPTEISVPPTMAPSQVPSVNPTYSPSAIPTTDPTDSPSFMPSAIPSYIITDTPSMVPTDVPTYTVTEAPSGPSYMPTYHPFQNFADSEAPTMLPTEFPSFVPTAVPSLVPTDTPTVHPTDIPTMAPSVFPTDAPSMHPTHVPSDVPTVTPSEVPSAMPSTTMPSQNPTTAPTVSPSMSFRPSASPTYVPTPQPSAPTAAPTVIAQSISFDASQVLDNISADTYNSNAAVNNNVMAAAIVDVTAGVSTSDITFSPAVSSSSTSSSELAPKMYLSLPATLSTTSCILTYTISIANTATAGFTNGEDAYTSISGQLTLAASDGSFTTAITTNAASQGVSDMASVSSGNMTYSDFTESTVTNSGSGGYELQTGDYVGIGIGGVIVLFLSVVGINLWRKGYFNAPEGATSGGRRGRSNTNQVQDYLGASRAGGSKAAAMASQADEGGTEMGAVASTDNPIAGGRGKRTNTFSSGPQRDTFSPPGNSTADARDTFASVSLEDGRDTFSPPV